MPTISRIHTRSALLALAGTLVTACGGSPAEQPAHSPLGVPSAGQLVQVTDTTVTTHLEASAVAEPIAQSTLSTKLMGVVTHVLVKEGDAVRAGQTLVRIDTRDLSAKRVQASASIASAQAAQREAELAVGRMRALFADSAAPRAQLDAAEAGLVRAEAGVRAAQAGDAELVAMADYGEVKAPFAGVVTQRAVDPGAFAAPGAPLVTVQDQRQLRVVAHVAPTSATGLRRGGSINGSIEGVPMVARIEAVVPGAGGLQMVNAVVDNRGARYAVGGSAMLRVPQGTRRAVLVPASAVRREGNLAGVEVLSAGGTGSVRWVTLGAAHGALIEVLAGLRPGETIRVPDATREN